MGRRSGDSLRKVAGFFAMKVGCCPHVKMKLSSWFIGFGVASGFARSR